MSNKPFILCISGISTSGKSEISENLKKNYGFQIISLDDYVFYDDNILPKFTLNGISDINYEDPKSIDWDEFISTLENLDPTEKYIIDGFIPFYSQKVESYINCLIDIEYNKTEFKEALRRRVQRDTGSDVPKDYEKNPNQSDAHFCSFYFKNFVWKEAFLHPEYRVPVNFSKPLLKLSATSPLKENFEKSGKFVIHNLKKFS